MVGMLFNNILYYNDCIYEFCYIIDFIIGNSIITTFLLYICSYTFGFCKWHRLIITANIINIFIATIDSYFKIQIEDVQLLLIYHIIYSIFIGVSTYIHIKEKK